MTDLLTGVLSNLSFILEDFINIKYLPAIFSNISTSLIVYLCLSILIIFLTRSKWPASGDGNDSTPKPSGKATICIYVLGQRALSYSLALVHLTPS